ncbi:MAG: WxL domain-containing protein, partial [Enterococcus sp.]
IHLTTEDGHAVGNELTIFKDQPIKLKIVTTDYEGTDVEGADGQGDFSKMVITDGVNLQGLSVGQHVITIRIPGQEDVFTKITVNVSGYLTLDQVPDLQFGKKDLSQFSQDPSFQLVSENNEGIKITDERFPTDGKTPWSLSVALSDFSNGKKPIAGKIDFASAQGEQGLLNGTVTSDGKLTFDKTGKPNLDQSVSENLAAETKLSITDAKQVETGAYQATLRWTLSNAPQ